MHCWPSKNSPLQKMCPCSSSSSKTSDLSNIYEAVQQIVALRISELLTQFDLPALTQAIREDPNVLARLTQALTKLSQGGLAAERQRLELAERIAALDKQKHPKKLGISPEAL